MNNTYITCPRHCTACQCLPALQAGTLRTAVGYGTAVSVPTEIRPYLCMFYVCMYDCVYVCMYACMYYIRQRK